ncbi:protoglobin domain-containing protein [Phormidium sp. FACHB-1136]|jgi:hypothetical protein|uniref:protoglobin domain-containing protein n=1 Tax=Phormidium sp. FACHB-1136 TaxID=2692848 RepID=UPI001684CC73|nr:protoglobin domain-containing protein [Phormidium sp. FACHB-1136]MBD2428251.1 hypothetical protein [Phormidium sp. FACHB-1136]
MSLEPTEFMSKMVSRIDFSADDKTVLQTAADWSLEIAAEMADYFYEYLGRDAEMSAILNESEGRVHRLRETFASWFHEMFTGMDGWGSDYAERRWRIGLIHVRIGIGPQHVVPAMAVVVHEAGKRAQTDGKDQSLRDALSKICMVDLAFIEQAYIEVSAAAVLKETGWSEGLFRRLIKTGAAAM